MQDLLVPPPQLSPLPTRRDRYVPVLQHRKGECTALRHASDRAWAQMVPLIEEVPHGAKMSHAAVKDRIRTLAVLLDGRPFYLDVKRTDPCASTPTRDGERPLLELLFEAARKRAMPCMPVAWADSPADHLALVRDIAAADGHGLALRHRLGPTVVPTDRSIARELGKTMEALAVEPSGADLVFDLQYIDRDRKPSAAWLAKLFASAMTVGRWRSLVLIGTSVPSGFSKDVLASGDTREFPRQEWRAWSEVAGRLDRELAYGDYAVQNPTPPLDPPPVGPFATIRYTTRECLLVARGWDVRQTSDDQYIELSQKVVAHSAFRGEDYSYGDQQIVAWSRERSADLSAFDVTAHDEEAANGLPASSSYWRGVGTSHHLEQVTEQLRGRSESA